MASIDTSSGSSSGSTRSASHSGVSISIAVPKVKTTGLPNSVSCSVGIWTTNFEGRNCSESISTSSKKTEALNAGRMGSKRPASKASRLTISSSEVSCQPAAARTPQSKDLPPCSMVPSTFSYS